MNKRWYLIVVSLCFLLSVFGCKADDTKLSVDTNSESSVMTSSVVPDGYRTQNAVILEADETHITAQLLTLPDEVKLTNSEIVYEEHKIIRFSRSEFSHTAKEELSDFEIGNVIALTFADYEATDTVWKLTDPVLCSFVAESLSSGGFFDATPIDFDPTEEHGKLKYGYVMKLQPGDWMGVVLLTSPRIDIAEYLESNGFFDGKIGYDASIGLDEFTVYTDLTNGGDTTGNTLSLQVGDVIAFAAEARPEEIYPQMYHAANYVEILSRDSAES
ncbi:MAG: hypothetical protein IJW77_04695 [Clostridia bacterium]|nr:hypothetical protein [Clostridia bacterium]